jgi:hypothetical protein
MGAQVRRLLCKLGRHRWRDLDRTQKPDGRVFDWAIDNQLRRANVGEPLLRVCRDCGRVESAAFTGRFSRADHLEPEVLP